MKEILYRSNVVSLLSCMLIVCFSLFYNDVKACDTSPVITLSNVTDIGGGFFTVDIQMCIGDGGSASGFTTSITGGLNITAFTPLTLTDNNLAIGSISGGVLDYNYAGGTGPANMFVNENANTCFNYTVTLDGDPAGETANFDGINSGHAGSCTVGAGGGTGSSSVPAPAPSCGSNYFDPGGASGNYGNNDFVTYTICPDVPGEDVTLTFSAFNLESGFDNLLIWDGNSATGGADYTFTGTTIPGPVTATNPSGCLTVRFDSDGSVTRPGFEAVVSCPTTLPVELISFKGNSSNNQSNILTWTTASEINNDHFVLERGSNLGGVIKWENVDYIKGGGNSNEFLNYKYEDFSFVFNTVNYYRLKQVDFDGDSEYSEILSINNNIIVDYEISELYPNPTSQEFSFEILIKPNSEIISFQIYNSLGNLLKEDDIINTTNNSSFNVDVTDLSNGLYFVHLSIAGKKQIKKLTIVK